MTVNRSKLVSKQQRDDKGRWTTALKPKAVLIDEKGDFGRSSRSSKTMSVTAGVYSDLTGLTALVDSTPKNTKHTKDPGVLKFTTSTDDVRVDVLNALAYEDPLIRSIVVNKADIPLNVGLDTKMRDMTRDVLKDVLLEVPGEMDVIIDYRNDLKNGKGCRMTEKAAKEIDRNILSCTVIRSAEYKPLQAHDFAAGAIGHETEENDPTFHNIIREKTRVKQYVKK